MALFGPASPQPLSLGTLAVPQGAVTSVAFSRDGTHLAAAFKEGAATAGGVALFDVSLDSWRRMAGWIANRNFTRAEWRDSFPDAPYRRTFRSLPWPRDLPDDEKATAVTWEANHPQEDDSA